MIQLQAKLCGVIAVFGLAGLALAQERNSAWIESPPARSLSPEWIEFRASIPAIEDQAWVLLAENRATLEVDTLHVGQGALDPSETLSVGPLAPGPWRLSIALPAGGSFALPPVDILVGREQVGGFPVGEAREIQGLNALPTPWLDRQGVVWAQPAEGQVLRAGSSMLHALGPEGSVPAGFPVDLARHDISVYSGASPQRVASSDGPGIALLGERYMALLSGNGALLQRIDLQGSPSSELVGWRTLSGEQRLAWTESLDSSLLLSISDGDLQLLHELTLPVTSLYYTAQLCLADLDGDWSDELWCAIHDSASSQALLFRVDCESGTALPAASFGDRVPFALASGELNGDASADLLLQTGDRLIALDASGTLWTRDLELELASRPTLVDLDGQGGQEILLCSWHPDLHGQLRILEGSTGEYSAAFQAPDLASGERSVQAPLAMDWDGNGSTDLVLLTHVKHPEHFYGQVKVFAADGQLLDSWYLAGLPLSGLRVWDLDQDGQAELLLQDSAGRLNSWSTAGGKMPLNKALGEGGNSQRYARPLPAGTFAGGWLEGRLLVQDTLLLPEEAQWKGAGFSLGRGQVRVEGILDLQGSVTVEKEARLEFRTGSQILGPLLDLHLRGSLLLKGQQAPMAQNLTSPPSGLSWVLNKLSLQPAAGASLRLENTLITGLQQPLVFGPEQRLELVDSWMVDGEGIVLQGAAFSASNCLLKGNETLLHLLEGAEAVIQRSSFSSSDEALIHVEDSRLQVDESLFLCNATAVLIENPLEVLMDSCHFQGNILALDVLRGAAAVRVSNSDFVECGQAALRNQDPLASVDARYCYWFDPQSVIGLADLGGSSGQPYFEPELPAPIFDLQPSPMIEGDEPLLTWQPVQYTQNGIPVSPSYRVYSSTDAFDVLRPENLVETVTQPVYYGQVQEGKIFYVIEPWLGKVSE